jgi:hypothetical protein
MKIKSSLSKTAGSFQKPTLALQWLIVNLVVLLLGSMAVTSVHAVDTVAQVHEEQEAESACEPELCAQLISQGRLYTQWMLEGDFDKLLPYLHEEFPPEIFPDVQLILQELGAQTQVVTERLTPLAGVFIYVQIATFENVPVPLALLLYLDPEGLLASLDFNVAEAPSNYLDYRTKTRLRLPFNGAWTVAWGGRTIELNQHAFEISQRFAHDLYVMVDGETHYGSGEDNEQYYCFGRPILAPGHGVVVTAVDGVEDNVPGVSNPAQIGGNYVIIDHGNGEYSVLAHFKQNTIVVQPGQKVRAGQRLGACGNSGNSSEAHLHYHLQDTPVLFQAEGLPAQFVNYVADGVRVKRGELLRWQVVSPRHKKHFRKFNKSNYRFSLKDHK